MLAVASAVLFFASILLHELGHAFVARRHNIGVSAITLWMFGGFARLEKDPDTPGTEFKIAIAGPLVTAVIVARLRDRRPVCWPGAHEFKHAVLTQGDTSTSGIAAVVSWLASINLPGPDLQPGPGFPARRRPDHTRDRLEAHRQPQHRHPLRGHARRVLRLFLILGGLGYFLVYLATSSAGSGSRSSASSSAAPPAALAAEAEQPDRRDLASPT